MFLKNVSFVLLFAAFLSIAGAVDSPQLYRVPEKKFIFFGWDNPTPEYLAKNLEMLEKTLPYDGMGISILSKTDQPPCRSLPQGGGVHRRTDVRFGQ